MLKVNLRLSTDWASTVWKMGFICIYMVRGITVRHDMHYFDKYYSNTCELWLDYKKNYCVYFYEMKIAPLLGISKHCFTDPSPFTFLTPYPWLQPVVLKRNRTYKWGTNMSHHNFQDQCIYLWQSGREWDVILVSLRQHVWGCHTYNNHPLNQRKFWANIQNKR